MSRTPTDGTGHSKRPHLMYEHRTAPLLPWPAFLRRLVRHGGYAGALVAGSMLAGTAGFIGFAHQEPIDALLNTAMLLGGMGPVGEIRTTGGKLFAAAYALYAGLVFLGTGAILFAPMLHRMLHRLHLQDRAGSPRNGE
jgi:hypothetical protein